MAALPFTAFSQQALPELPPMPVTGDMGELPPPPPVPGPPQTIGGPVPAAVIPPFAFSCRSDVENLIASAIGEALVEARKRGVEVVTDRVQVSQSYMTSYLAGNGVNFRWSRGQDGRGVMHHKFAVVDAKLLMTGSFNWSINAQSNNFENMYYPAAPAYVTAFTAHFDQVFGSAVVPSAEEMQSLASQTSFEEE